MSDIKQFVKDPKFLALSTEAKRIVLAQQDARFSSMSPEAQNMVITDLETPETARAGPVGRFATGMGESMNPIPGLLQAVAHPIDTIKALASDPQDPTVKNLPLPILGTGPVANIAKNMIMGPINAMKEKASTGDYAGALGSGAGTALTLALPALAGKAKVKIPGASTLDAVSQRAVATADARGIPVDLAQRTGNTTLQGIKAGTARIPGAAGVYSEFNLRQATKIESVMEQLGTEISPTGSKWKIRAGADLRGEIADAGKNYKSMVDDSKDVIVALAETKGKRSVVTGTVRNGKLNPDGTFQVDPVYGEMASPIDYKNLDTQIDLVLKDMNNSIDATKHQANPALAILQQIRERGRFVPLKDALDDLAALNQANSYVATYSRTRSEGLANYGAESLRLQIKEEIGKLGPEAQKAYAERIEGTKGRKQAKDIQTTLFGKKEDLERDVKAVNFLTAPDDTNAKYLQWITKNKPQSLPGVGKAYVEDLVRDVVIAKDRGWKSAANKFNGLGPITQKSLYGPEAQEIGDLFNFAAMTAQNANPSGSATVGTLMATGHMLLRDPLRGTAYILSARQLAKLITSPNGAQLMKEGLQVPLLSPTAYAVSSVMLMNAGVEDTIK